MAFCGCSPCPRPGAWACHPGTFVLWAGAGDFHGDEASGGFVKGGDLYQVGVARSQAADAEVGESAAEAAGVFAAGEFRAEHGAGGPVVYGKDRVVGRADGTAGADAGGDVGGDKGEPE